VSLGFPLGSAAKPGPGFFPVGVGVFLVTVSIAFVVAVFRGQAGIGRWSAAPLTPDSLLRVAATMAALVGFCLVLPWVGYPVAAFLFTAVLLRSLGARGWIGPVVAALLASAGSYYLFAVLLGVPLPKGVLFD
jgi:putative tricarboxylic transport membrane protein